MGSSRYLIGLLALGMVGSANTALADPSPFSFVTNGYSEGKGNVEYEQKIFWKSHKADDTSYNNIKFEHEFEIGLADNFDLGIYAAKWDYEDSDKRTGTHFGQFAVEGKFYITNPAVDPVGIGLASEVGVGENSIAFEQKLIVQKDIGNLTLAYNLELETEVEGLFDSQNEEVEVEGELENLFGVSYALDSHWRVGGELIVKSKYENWNDYEGTTVYAGPAINYSGALNRNIDFFVTVTPAIQLTNRDSEADFETRIVLGLEF